ncbi:MAG: bifunctional phosphoribosylaminoimidazolecarboxamide formyltransferase/IMP cyclohydrolase, partial [Spirochaetes bacterium]|nr:bifunctional phosphoribosylaminoimidazolecarboxamide formyltransferase/IMP cyclohydrolase [Spirochaetota bacterium]
MKIKTALISVYDKKGVVEFARELHRLGITILSTGGTARILEENNIPVIKIEDYSGNPEILDGRVKTLSFKVFGGILAIRDSHEHIRQMEERDIKSIDMVVVNLYPFEEMMKKKMSVQEMIEYIDIGGNTLLRAAAKNFKYVVPVYNRKYYPDIIMELKTNKGEINDEIRMSLARETFFFTSYYDSLISRYLSQSLGEKSYPLYYNVAFEKIQDLRYGENPHQEAVYYKLYNSDNPPFKQLAGKELSFNNIFDFYAAVNLIAELGKNFKKPACAIIKHRNA